MQLVVSVVLGILVGYGAGFMVWAENIIDEAKLRATQASEAGTAPKSESEFISLQLKADKEPYLGPRALGFQIARDPNYASVTRRRYGTYGALWGGSIGFLMCCFWDEAKRRTKSE